MYVYECNTYILVLFVLISTRKAIYSWWMRLLKMRELHNSYLVKWFFWEKQSNLADEAKNIIRTGLPSSLCPQPGQCLDPHNWCSSSFASMRSELLTDPSWLFLFIVQPNTPYIPSNIYFSLFFRWYNYYSIQILTSLSLFFLIQLHPTYSQIFINHMQPLHIYIFKNIDSYYYCIYVHDHYISRTNSWWN